MAAGVPKLRLLVGGALVEGERVTLEQLSREERAGASELIRFLGGAKHVLILRRPVVHQGGERIEARYLVVRQDQIQACEFIIPEKAGVSPSEYDSFRWEWDD